MIESASQAEQNIFELLEVFRRPFPAGAEAGVYIIRYATKENYVPYKLLARDEIMLQDFYYLLRIRTTCLKNVAPGLMG